MWGPIVGGLIGAAASLFGGRRREESGREANEANAALQREFAQHGISWKVADAKAAGIHPLYALGASTTSAAPSYVMTEGPDYAAMGQNVARAAQAVLDTDEKAMNAARLKVLESEAEKNFAMASAAKSEEQRAWLNTWTSKSIPGMGLDGMGLKADPFWALSSDVGVHRARSNEALLGELAPGAVSGPVGRVKASPDEVISARAGAPQLTAGRHPAFSEYEVSPGLRMQLPQTQEGPGEAMENVPLWMWPSLISYNSRFYGPGWFSKFLDEWLVPSSLGGGKRNFRDLADRLDETKRQIARPLFPEQRERPRSKASGDSFYGAP